MAASGGIVLGTNLQALNPGSNIPWIEPLNRIFNDLRQKNDEVRTKAIQQLGSYVTGMVKDEPMETFTKFLTDLNTRVSLYMNGSNKEERTGGTLAVEKLITIDYDTLENADKLLKFKHYLAATLLTATDSQTLGIAARTLGNLARVGGNLGEISNAINEQLTRALEWLRDNGSSAIRKQAALFVLKELAISAPSLFHPHVSTFIGIVWSSAFLHENIIIRESAVDALRAVLDVVGNRDTGSQSTRYLELYIQAQAGLKNKESVTFCHASLLVYGELLINTGNFIHEAGRDRYREICDAVLRHRDSHHKVIKKTVITLLPRLARFSPEAFNQHINLCINYLIVTSKKEERARCFLSIGEIAMAVGANIQAYWEGILGVVKQSLRSNNKKSDFLPEALTCVGYLARASAPGLRAQIEDLIPDMLTNGLSNTLISSLENISIGYPASMATVQQHLLIYLSQILGYKAVNAGSSPSTAINGDKYQKRQIAQSSTDIKPDIPSFEEITLALEVLGSFDFVANTNVRSFDEYIVGMVRDCVVDYLDHELVAIRKQAALSCARLMGIAVSRKGMSPLLSELLERLLIVQTTDADESVRRVILQSLDSRFDIMLARPEMLKSLFLALNDEFFEIRELAIAIIGRLTILNPAHVMPSLRKTLIQLLLAMQYSGDSRRKEESARLLAHLFSSSHRLIGSYVRLIMETLVPKLSEKEHPRVTTRILAALAELSVAAASEMRTKHSLIVPPILEILQDQGSASRREGAFQILRKYVSYTGYVVQPFLDYPQLMTIIYNEIRSESDTSLKMEVLKTLGTLGALDPARSIFSQTKTVGPSSVVDKNQVASREAPSTMKSTTEGYYHSVAINALVKIMRDPSLSIYYQKAINALAIILKSLKAKCGPFVPLIMPPFLAMVRTADDISRKWLLQQLGVFMTICKFHMRPYLDQIFAIIEDYWDSNLIEVMALVEDICNGITEEFKVFLPSLIPRMLKALRQDSPDRISKVLHALETFGANLDDYLHLVIPSIVSLLDEDITPPEVVAMAIQSISKLSKMNSLSDYASQIIHPLVRLLDCPLPDIKLKEAHTAVTDMREKIFKALCCMVGHLGLDYAIFIPMVNKMMIRHGIQHTTYGNLVSSLMQLKRDQRGIEDWQRSLTAVDESAPNSFVSRRTFADIAPMLPTVSSANLKKLWQTGERHTAEDWADWIRGFSVGLLSESPSAVRWCKTLADEYYPLFRDLFNAGFISCWVELDEISQADLVSNLRRAIKTPNIPREILHTLLDLAEFMEHEDKRLPIEIDTLAELAEECSAYAKALFYKEQRFLSDPNGTIESLISLNNKLGQARAAEGLLRYANQHFRLSTRELEAWYEKLQQWDSALMVYQRRFKEARSPGPESKEWTESLFGQIRCLYALGEWSDLQQLSADNWERLETKQKRIIGPLAAQAAWNNSSWSAMEMFSLGIDNGTVDGTFYSSALAVHSGDMSLATSLISQTRSHLDNEITTMMRQSYGRAYNHIVMLEQLTELEEVMEYKRSEDFPERQSTIVKMWEDRLNGAQQNVDTWAKLLAVRSLILVPEHHPDMWIKFSSLCRKSERFPRLAEKTLENILHISSHPSGEIPALPASKGSVSYAYLKHCWETGRTQQAFDSLKELAPTINQDDKQLRAKIHQKLGTWQAALQPLDEQAIPLIIGSFSSCTKLAPKWYRGWHAWAMANFDAVSHYEKKGKFGDTSDGIPVDLSEDTSGQLTLQTQDIMHEYLISAIRGFFRSIALSPSMSLQDTLRLLTLWFKYGRLKEVETTLMEGFSTVSIDTWLRVIPQLIARIAAPVQSVRRLVHELLINVGKEHPQSLVFPLNLALKSMSPTRAEASLAVLNNMRKYYDDLVGQALMVSEELVRVAIVWFELWHEGLEDASRFHFAENNPQLAVTRLRPLHEMMLKGPETLQEVSFMQMSGRDLAEAAEWTSRYEESGRISDFNQAWDLYYNVFRYTKSSVNSLTQLNVEHVSPRLFSARDLQLVLPGSYRPGRKPVTIYSFNNRLEIIPSKQHPRKLGIYGSDGIERNFLLKGHEDLRQDERAMQLFGLVNGLLDSSVKTYRSHVKIQRYAVVPLTPNSGLIGWVPHCDTLHAVIKEYRESKNIVLNTENRFVLKESQDYQNLPSIQKFEIFGRVLQSTDGSDLKNILWIQNRTAETWLEKRTNYTQSLATMSMVGYILGLGDRHCSNLMLDRQSGKIVHIDFGDCFEVAMNRDKHPERVPFRLTRMLEAAMGVSKIEGDYRSTCESVMAVLRDNRESLMAVLEAFVYDPLIGWKLLGTNAPKEDTDKGMSADTVQTGAEAQLAMEEVMPSAVNKTDKLNKSLSDEAHEVGGEVLNSKAMDIIGRIQNKLTGRDYPKESPQVNVEQQVDLLIKQANSLENLAQAYLGWSPYW